METVPHSSLGMPYFDYGYQSSQVRGMSLQAATWGGLALSEPPLAGWQGQTPPSERPPTALIASAPVHAHVSAPQEGAERAGQFQAGYSQLLLSEVARLEAEDIDEGQLDRLMASLQSRLRSGDEAVAQALELVATAFRSSLALETLAAARVRKFDSYTFRVIRAALTSESEVLRFTAVAAASDLPSAMRRLLVVDLSKAASDSEPNEDVRRSARNLLRRMK